MESNCRLTNDERLYTMALQQFGKEFKPPIDEGVMLYFEIENLDQYSEKLAQEQIKFDQMPQQMPWGWKHAI